MRKQKRQAHQVSVHTHIKVPLLKIELQIFSMVHGSLRINL